MGRGMSVEGLEGVWRQFSHTAEQDALDHEEVLLSESPRGLQFGAVRMVSLVNLVSTLCSFEGIHI